MTLPATPTPQFDTFYKYDALTRLLFDYADAHPMGKHGKHDYKLEEYGLTEQQICDRFAFYIERFQVPMA